MESPGEDDQDNGGFGGVVAAAGVGDGLRRRGADGNAGGRPADGRAGAAGGHGDSHRGAGCRPGGHGDAGDAGRRDGGGAKRHHYRGAEGAGAVYGASRADGEPADFRHANRAYWRIAADGFQRPEAGGYAGEELGSVGGWRDLDFPAE